jgi:hypothetical protein
MHLDRQIKDRTPALTVGCGQLIDTDQSLTAIQFARRLQKITASIENFFQCQVERLKSTLTTCQKDIDRAHEIQQMLAGFALQKQCWEIERAAEVARLDGACAQLMEGWKQLEDARRQLLIEKSAIQAQQTERLNQPAESSAWGWGESAADSSQSSARPSRELTTAELEKLRQAMHQHRNSNC